MLITCDDERDGDVSRALTNTVPYYLLLFISDCDRSFPAPILGFIQDHRDHRIPLLPAAQPRVWGKFCLFV